MIEFHGLQFFRKEIPGCSRPSLEVPRTIRQPARRFGTSVEHFLELALAFFSRITFRDLLRYWFRLTSAHIATPRELPAALYGGILRAAWRARLGSCFGT